MRSSPSPTWTLTWGVRPARLAPTVRRRDAPSVSARASSSTDGLVTDSHGSPFTPCRTPPLHPDDTARSAIAGARLRRAIYAPAPSGGAPGRAAARQGSGTNEDLSIGVEAGVPVIISSSRRNCYIATASCSNEPGKRCKKGALALHPSTSPPYPPYPSALGDRRSCWILEPFGCRRDCSPPARPSTWSQRPLPASTWRRLVVSLLLCRS